MTDMVKIKFTKNSLPYAKGQEAWFNELQAAAYVKQDFAERVKNPGPFVPAPPRPALLAAQTDLTADEVAFVKWMYAERLRGRSAA